MCSEMQYLNDDGEEGKFRRLVKVDWKQGEAFESEEVVVMGSDMLEVRSIGKMISIFDTFCVRLAAGGLHYVEDSLVCLDGCMKTV